MALSYDESQTLMNDMTMRGKIKVAALKFADSIVISTIPVSTQTALVKWAFECFRTPDTVAGQIQPTVIMDAKVQTAGKDVTDDDLQAAVETVVRKVN